MVKRNKNFLSPINFRNTEYGFTMLEMIVIIVLLGITLKFAMPSFNKPNTMMDVARRFIALAGNLRSMSVRDQQIQILNFSAAGFSPGYGEKTESILTEKKDHSTRTITLPDNVSLLDVERPNGEKETSGRIHFYKNGYADTVAVHLENDGGDEITLVVEPFLSKVRLYEGYREISE
ncbi:Protein containing Prepilin-type cleavage/methylation [Candidatus Magnetomoraceae bacterium gMMP-15]